MLWFTIWTLLVLATLGGAFLLGRSLWRKGKALLAELGRASEVAAALSERAEQLSAAAADAPPRTHDVLGDRAVYRSRLTALRTEHDERREARRLRREQTRAGWRAYTR